MSCSKCAMQTAHLSPALKGGGHPGGEDGEGYELRNL
jgi:hypothetical protein